ncbi:MAG TPA: hypothetical protein EYP24_04275, partial [bacterium (Candidatus Stahlbacteria)]|nr:hypothetical protein [Candidatus Stahlbacteria bacterium]
MVLLIFILQFDRSEFHKMKTESFMHHRYDRFIAYAEGLKREYPDQDEIYLGIIEAYRYLNKNDKIIETAEEYLTRRPERAVFFRLISFLTAKRKELVPELTGLYRRLIRDPLFYSWNLYLHYRSARRYE